MCSIERALFPSISVHSCDLARRVVPNPLDEGIDRYFGSGERLEAASLGRTHLRPAYCVAEFAVDNPDFPGRDLRCGVRRAFVSSVNEVRRMKLWLCAGFYECPELSESISQYFRPIDSPQRFCCNSKIELSPGGMAMQSTEAVSLPLGIPIGLEAIFEEME
jgi:hypothetical protein